MDRLLVELDLRTGAVLAGLGLLTSPLVPETGSACMAARGPSAIPKRPVELGIPEEAQGRVIIHCWVCGQKNRLFSLGTSESPACGCE